MTRQQQIDEARAALRAGDARAARALLVSANTANSVEGTEGAATARGERGAGDEHGSGGVDGAQEADGTSGTSEVGGAGGTSEVGGTNGTNDVGGAGGERRLDGAGAAVGVRGVHGMSRVRGADGTDGKHPFGGIAQQAGGAGPVGGASGTGIVGGPGGVGGADGMGGADGADGVDGVGGVGGADGADGVGGVGGADGADGVGGVGGVGGVSGADGRGGVGGEGAVGRAGGGGGLGHAGGAGGLGSGGGAAGLEVMASASFVLLEFERALAEMEAAYAGYRAAGDGAGAARVARMLGGMHGSTSGDWAVAAGWIARAKTLLADQPESVERGWVALTEGMFEVDRSRKNDRFRQAIELGRKYHDNDLTFAALAYLGASLVHGDRAEEGVVLLDEACAAVAGDEVDSFIVVEEIFCQLFSACEHARDVRRAEQWIRIGERIAERRRLPAVSAYCHTHYGGILTAAGRWPEAEATLTEAIRLWALGRRTLKAGALARLADLRVKQGRYDEAATLLDGLTDGDAVRPRASLLLARGENAVALALLEHAVSTTDRGSSSCLALLALLADAQLANGVNPDATIEQMTACADAHPSAYANAVVALAHGRAGHGDPKVWLRQALDGFAQAELPLEESLCRLDLARACSHDQPAVAIAEARNALRRLEMLNAARHVDAAAALLRQLGERVAPVRPAGHQLTQREEDVLRLLGDGLSNPEIADRLFISRKTVEHHVGNILHKLGLRNRAEAAAYAVRREPATK